MKSVSVLCVHIEMDVNTAEETSAEVSLVMSVFPILVSLYSSASMLTSTTKAIWD